MSHCGLNRASAKRFQTPILKKYGITLALITQALVGKNLFAEGFKSNFNSSFQQPGPLTRQQAAKQEQTNFHSNYMIKGAVGFDTLALPALLTISGNRHLSSDLNAHLNMEWRPKINNFSKYFDDSAEEFKNSQSWLGGNLNGGLRWSQYSKFRLGMGGSADFVRVGPGGFGSLYGALEGGTRDYKITLFTGGGVNTVSSEESLKKVKTAPIFGATISGTVKNFFLIDLTAGKTFGKNIRPQSIADTLKTITSPCFGNISLTVPLAKWIGIGLGGGSDNLFNFASNDLIKTTDQWRQSINWGAFLVIGWSKAQGPYFLSNKKLDPWMINHSISISGHRALSYSEEELSSNAVLENYPASDLVFKAQNHDSISQASASLSDLSAHPSTLNARSILSTQESQSAHASYRTRNAISRKSAPPSTILSQPSPTKSDELTIKISELEESVRKPWTDDDLVAIYSFSNLEKMQRIQAGQKRREDALFLEKFVTTKDFKLTEIPLNAEFSPLQEFFGFRINEEENSVSVDTVYREILRNCNSVEEKLGLFLFGITGTKIDSDWPTSQAKWPICIYPASEDKALQKFFEENITVHCRMIRSEQDSKKGLLAVALSAKKDVMRNFKNLKLARDLMTKEYSCSYFSRDILNESVSAVNDVTQAILKKFTTSHKLYYRSDRWKSPYFSEVAPKVSKDKNQMQSSGKLYSLDGKNNIALDFYLRGMPIKCEAIDRSHNAEDKIYKKAPVSCFKEIEAVSRKEDFKTNKVDLILSHCDEKNQIGYFTAQAVPVEKYFVNANTDSSENRDLYPFRTTRKEDLMQMHNTIADKYKHYKLSVTLPKKEEMIEVREALKQLAAHRLYNDLNKSRPDFWYLSENTNDWKVLCWDDNDSSKKASATLIVPIGQGVN